ncbi:MAG: uracil phosphoribosyltransferase [Gammaproteobacteria bacterium]|jgi:uracil phosphoribosyltransferase|nr:uracil phosphoribosyltransferase [Gammaproteobacteria bacterium]NCW74099.1 uracil phosphoribosyltransferase [Gammaproteobacteria bacterium]NCX49252.1 uracil phosphoribosyltransferase [Gammaproteobacteria bacterium]
MATVSESHNPLVLDRITRLRDKATSSREFRQFVKEITILLAADATNELPMVDIDVETPLQVTTGQLVSQPGPCIVSIMRAGNVMAETLRDLISDASIGFIGLARQPVTLEIDDYYTNLPSDIQDRYCIVVDPMLATGNSLSVAIKKLIDTGVSQITVVNILACPEGIQRITSEYPDVRIVVAKVDDKLNEKGYILPGLGDAGDRIYGTDDH